MGTFDGLMYGEREGKAGEKMVLTSGLFLQKARNMANTDSL